MPHRVPLRLGVKAVASDMALVEAGRRVQRKFGKAGCEVLEASVTEEKHSNMKVIDAT